MKFVVTGVAAIGLALTMPAFAQNPTKTQTPTGQFEYQGGGSAQKDPTGQYNQGGATAQTGTAQTGPVGQHDQGRAAAKKGKKHQ